jgi:hypothetical protein
MTKSKFPSTDDVWLMAVMSFLAMHAPLFSCSHFNTTINETMTNAIHKW